MLTDSRKSLQFSYNFLNLLGEVKSGSTVKAKYTWLADGSKLRVRNNSTAGFDYLGSLTYTSSSSGLTLETAQFAGGVIRSGNSQEINYFITDHLGSVRAIVNSAGTAVEQNDYYAFGAKHVRSTYAKNSNRLDYNGKEEQTTGDLDYLDYGARMYDPTIGRWFNIDPLAEKYYTFSTYNYAVNNPINAIDIDGRLIIFISGWDLMKNISAIFDAFPTHRRPGLIIEREMSRRDRSLTQIPNYLGSLASTYRRTFHDSNIWYIDGHNNLPSKASERHDDGYNSGLELVNKLMSGELTLNEGETIKLVGHSMGAAFAAGMAKALWESNFKDRLELVDYIAAYQSGDFSHIAEILGRQFGSINDRFSNRGKVQIEGVRIFETDDLKGGFADFGHWSGDLVNWLSGVISAGVPVYVVE